MPKDPPTINGEHHTNGEKSHFTGENDFAYQPLDVEKGGNSSNGLKGHGESYSNSRM